MKPWFVVASWVFFTIGLTSQSLAQWVHTEGEDNPFAGGAAHMAATLSAIGELVGFRCTSPDDLALLFVSMEKPRDRDVPMLSVLAALPMRLLVIVDNEPRREFEAKSDLTPVGDRYRFTATDKALGELVKTAATAKKRFAIAVEINGKMAYTTAVNTMGSRKALSDLASGCKLP